VGQSPFSNAKGVSLLEPTSVLLAAFDNLDFVTAFVTTLGLIVEPSRPGRALGDLRNSALDASLCLSFYHIDNLPTILGNRGDRRATPMPGAAAVCELPVRELFPG